MFVGQYYVSDGNGENMYTIFQCFGQTLDMVSRSLAEAVSTWLLEGDVRLFDSAHVVRQVELCKGFDSVSFLTEGGVKVWHETPDGPGVTSWSISLA